MKRGGAFGMDGVLVSLAAGASAAPPTPSRRERLVMPPRGDAVTFMKGVYDHGVGRTVGRDAMPAAGPSRLSQHAEQSMKARLVAQHGVVRIILHPVAFAAT